MRAYRPSKHTFSQKAYLKGAQWQLSNSLSYTDTSSVQAIQHVQLLKGLRSKMIERLAVVVNLHER